MRHFNPQRWGQDPKQCITASVASLLGLPLWAVPKFNGDVNAVEEWVMGPLTTSTGREFIVGWHFGGAPEGFALAWGVAKKSDEGHCVVVYDGEIWHDPSGYGLSITDAYMTIVMKSY